MIKKLLFALAMICLGSLGVIIYNNDFEMTRHDTVIKDKGETIAVEYAKPKNNKQKPGLILFIHGDGPANKNSDEGYYPAWETLAKENFISLSWDKAGVGESSGNWLDQDMTDRQEEADKVLAWALEHLDVDPEKVGVWGASQGGWVIPKLLKDNDHVKFAIGVAPAVNWLRQGTFNTKSEMAFEGYTEKEMAAKLATEAKINEFLKKDDYQGYLDSKLDQEPIPKDRWGFIRKNMWLDNTEELGYVTKPYYLLIGDHDINVDTKETERVYREHIKDPYLTVYPIRQATHRMLKPRHQKDNLLTVVESIFNPREIFAPDYLKGLKEIGEEISN